MIPFFKNEFFLLHWIKLICLVPACLVLATFSQAQTSNASLPALIPSSANTTSKEIFPDALCGIELNYTTGPYGEIELTLKKYFGHRAVVDSTAEKLVVRESITGMVSAQPVLQLASIVIDTGIVNVRCAAYAGAYVKVATYTGIVKLMSPMMGGYDVTLGYCCWDIHPNLVNVQGLREAKKQGMSLNLHIPEMASSARNSSPDFKTVPVLTTCLNQLVSFTTRVVDADGDSLAYAFCPIDDYRSASGFDNPAAPAIRPEKFLDVTFPGGRPPFQPVTYTKGYDFSSPMKDKQMTIDSRTGMINMKPDTVGDYLVGIVVKEFRNGKLLGAYKRVIKIKVVS